MKSETSVQTKFASPGYYAIPELKQTYDLWWNKLSQILQECGDFTWKVSDCEELSGD